MKRRGFLGALLAVPAAGVAAFHVEQPEIVCTFPDGSVSKTYYDEMYTTPELYGRMTISKGRQIRRGAFPRILDREMRRLVADAKESARVIVENAGG